MRSIAAAFVLVVALSAPVQAQYGSTVSTSGGVVGSAQPIPNVPCPPWGSWTFCNSVQQWIALYNQYVALQNQLQQAQQNALRYATYPGQVQSAIQTDLAQVAATMNQLGGLSFLDKQINQSVQRLFPGWVSGMNYGDAVDTLSASVNQSVRNALAQAGYEMSTTQRDADTATMIKTAIAQSTSPTQAIQALGMLNGVMLEALQKHQRITASALYASSSYYLASAQDRQNKSKSETQAIAAMQAFLSGKVTVPPGTRAAP